MNNTVLALFILISALGSGIVAGAFFAFSTFVMRALGRIPAAQGILAMQTINVTVINPLFMLALFGTGATCLVVAISAGLALERAGSALALSGALLYVAGVVGVTLFANVPRNNALAAIDPATPDAARLWSGYLSTWTAWNHVRSVAGVAASAILMLAFHATRLHGAE